MQSKLKQGARRNPSRWRVERLLSQVKDEHCAAGRIEALSRCLLGSAYTPNPLIGSAEIPEVFTASLDGFDCVTYVETVLALSRARGADDFARWLRKIRYDGGRVQWRRRNHYMSQWIRNNVREGIIRPLAMRAIPSLSRERLLNVVAGIPHKRTRLTCTPKQAAARIASLLCGGDLIFFVSTRRNLDVFHCGIIVRDGKTILMRHASRSEGSVVEQPLGDFLKSNRMTGVIVVRPREPGRAVRV